MARTRNMAASMANAVKLAIGRAVLRAVSDKPGRQFVQFEALQNEVKDGIERVQQYGFTSHPIPGASVVFVCVGSNRDHPVAIAVDDPRYRKANMSPGEVAIYTDEGDYVHLKRGRIVEINTDKLVVKASNSVRMETPILEVTGHIIDRCDAEGQSMHAMRAIYNTHTHPETNSGSTQQPNQTMGGA